MFALLAMAGDLGGSIGPGIVGHITQSAGNNIQVGMGIGLIFPAILLIMLFILHTKKKYQEDYFYFKGNCEYNIQDAESQALHPIEDAFGNPKALRAFLSTNVSLSTL